MTTRECRLGSHWAGLIGASMAILLGACSEEVPATPAAEGGESSPGAQGSSEQMARSLKVDPSFQDSLIADGSVTRADLELGYNMLFDCFRDSNAEGEVRINLDLDSSYTLLLTVPDSSGNFPEDPDVAAKLNEDTVNFCEASYIDRLQRTYVAQNPPSRDLEQRRHATVAACLTHSAPSFANTLDDSMSMDDIRARASTDSSSTDPDEALAVQNCVYEYGSPPQNISVAKP